MQQAAPQHLLRSESGRLLPGVAPDEREGNGQDTTLGMVAKGLPGTVLKRLPASSLSEVHPAELAEQTDAWLTAITDTLARFVSRFPASDRPRRTRSDPGADALHAVDTTGRGVGIGTVAWGEPVHGPGRPGRTRRGERSA